MTDSEHDDRVAMMLAASSNGTMIVNPGTGPVEGGTAGQARENVHALCAEVTPDPMKIVRYPRNDYGGGRYCFRLYANGRRCEIQMPGWPLEQVRFVDGLDPWLFPRLYVDDGSWLWTFAVSCVHEALFGDEGDEGDDDS